MSCHTWLYTKVVNPPTDNEMFTHFVKTTHEDGKHLHGYWDAKYDTFEQYNEEAYKDTTYKIISYDKLPDWLKKLAYKKTDLYDKPEATFNLVFDEHGLYKLTDDTYAHDPFRVYNYPSVRLHSYKEAEEFINSDKVIEQISDKDAVYYISPSKKEALKICKAIYDKQPDTLILFG